MREVRIGQKVYGVNASALALLFYKQEFRSDLISDFTKFSVAVEADNTNYDGLLLLQFLWAMNKASDLTRKQPPFESWLSSLTGLDFSDQEFITAVLAEAGAGFFPSYASGPAPEAK